MIHNYLQIVDEFQRMREIEGPEPPPVRKTAAAGGAGAMGAAAVQPSSPNLGSPQGGPSGSPVGSPLGMASGTSSPFSNAQGSPFEVRSASIIAWTCIQISLYSDTSTCISS